MKYFIFIIFLFCGCSICDKREVRDDQNNIIREDNKKIIENSSSHLSDWEKNEVKKSYLSMKFSLDASKETYKNKVVVLREKYSSYNGVLDLIIILDNQVSRELEVGRIIEAKHIIYNALNAL